MTAENDLSTITSQVLNSRNRSANPRIISDIRIIIQRNIEIYPHKYSLSFQICLLQCWNAPFRRHAYKSCSTNKQISITTIRLRGWQDYGIYGREWILTMRFKCGVVRSTFRCSQRQKEGSYEIYGKNGKYTWCGAPMGLLHFCQPFNFPFVLFFFFLFLKAKNWNIRSTKSN